MNKLKVIYVVSISICAFELLLFLISPFGGPLTIYRYMKEGLFSISAGYQVVFIQAEYYPHNNWVRNLEIMNIACAIAYFLCLMLACLSALCYKIDQKTKYKIGISFFVMSILFAKVGGYAWRYMVHSFVL